MDGILVIDKPAGMTSHDVIDRLRRHYHQKKFGHTGTLDPDATGVLVVMAGKACKALQFMENTSKEYEAVLALGTRTDTEDAGGNVVETRSVNPDFDFAAAVACLVGKHRLKVPACSAKKVAGRKLLDYQRQGREVPTVYQDIEVYQARVIDPDKLAFSVVCSSGTYVRSLCTLLAEKTGNIGHMQSLRRTRAGAFTIQEAEPLEQDMHTVHPLKEALDHFETVVLPDDTPVLQGKRLVLETDADQVLVTDVRGEPLAVYEKDGPEYKSKRGLW